MPDYCPQREIPVAIRRSLRQEANFGCAKCGNPLIQMHHIIPWNQTHTHNPEDMLALCPNDHYRADMHEYSEVYLRELKHSPHNAICVNDAFMVQTNELTVSLADIIFVNTPRILVVDDFDIISLNKENKFPQINVNFFDKFDRWIAIVDQNQWYVDTRTVWDIEYRPRHLIVRCTPRNISLELEIIDDVIFIRGTLYFNGYKIEATQNDLFMGGRSVLQIRGGRIANSSVGMGISTGKPPFSTRRENRRRGLYVP